MGNNKRQTVIEFLTEYATKEGYSTDTESLQETLSECGEIIFRGNRDQHRWYIAEEVVANFDGTFIMYTDYVITGDGCMRDMDLEYDLEAASIVERKERQVVEVYYE